MEWFDHATGTFNTSVCRYMKVLESFDGVRTTAQRNPHKYTVLGTSFMVLHICLVHQEAVTWAWDDDFEVQKFGRLKRSSLHKALQPISVC